MSGKIIEKSKNVASTVYALVKNTNDTFGVYIQRTNYCGHVKGGMITRWFTCVNNLTEIEARNYFSRVLKGKAK